MSIKQTKNKTGELIYVVRVARRHPITGRPFSLQRNAKSAAEAKRLQSQLANEISDRLHRVLVPTWKELLERYENHYLNQGLSRKTVADALYSLKAHTLEAWGERTVDRISTQEIRELVLSSLKDRSERHRVNMMKFIRSAFRIAVETNQLVKNPTPVLKFRPKDRLLSVLTRQQASLLLEKAKEKESPWYPLWCTALYTGMRSGELYALKWHHVSFSESRIKVRESWNNKDGFKSTKSGDERVIPLAGPLKIVFEELKLRSGGSEFVLPRIPYWSKGLQARELRRFTLGVGLPSIRFHDLRASWATFLLVDGVAPVRVMAMGGWKNIKTMMLYTRMAGIDLEGAIDSLDLHNPAASTPNVVPIVASLPNVANDR